MSSQVIILVVVLIVLVAVGVGGYFFYKSTKACPDKCSDTSCSNKRCTTCADGYGIDGTMTPDSSGKCPVYSPDPSASEPVTWTQTSDLDISGPSSQVVARNIDDCTADCKAISSCIGAAFDGSNCFLKKDPSHKYCTTAKSGWKITTKKTLPSCA